MLTGFVPFAVLFIELLFVFKNLWQDKSGYYYVFGFLSAVCTILLVTVSEVTIIATYTQLCAEVCFFLSSGGSELTTPELPLVVAKFRHRRQQRNLDLCLLHLVLLFQAACDGLRVESSLLQLQLPCLRCLRVVDGDGGVLDCLCICPAYLQVGCLICWWTWLTGWQ